MMCHEASHTFEIDEMYIVNSHLHFLFRARDIRMDVENLLRLGVDSTAITKLYKSFTYETWLQHVSKNEEDEDDKQLIVNPSGIPGKIIKCHLKNALVHKGRLVLHLDIHTVLQGEDVKEQTSNIRQKVAKYLHRCSWTEPKFLRLAMPSFYEPNASATELSDSCSLLQCAVEPPPAGTSLQELLDSETDVEEGGAGLLGKWLDSLRSEVSPAGAELQERTSGRESEIFETDLQEPSLWCISHKSDTTAETVFEDDDGEV